MGIDEKSKIFAECIKNLYLKGKYTVEYAILQLEKYKDAGKIIASDYEEYLSFFVSEMNEENEETDNVEIVESDDAEESVIENSEATENTEETIEDEEESV